MSTRLLDHDPLTGVSCWWTYQPHDDSVTISHTQDVTSIIERNKQAANDNDKTKRGIKGDWWKYASIPDAVWIKWRAEKGVDIFNPAHEKELFRLLNSRDYKYFKTTEKHHE